MNDSIMHHFLEDLLPIIVITSGLAAGAWVLSLIIAAFRHRAQLRAQTDYQNKIIEKFSSADEFAAYLKSDAGKSFFANLTSEPTSPMNKILGSIQKGAITTLLGVGLIVLGKSFSPEEGGNIMFVFGVVSFMTGAGFLVSSAISYKLAKTWGMISVGNTAVSNQPTSSSV